MSLPACVGAPGFEPGTSCAQVPFRLSLANASEAKLISRNANPAPLSGAGDSLYVSGRRDLNPGPPAPKFHSD